jgi:apolipoprotein N-acyltransferase
VKRALAALSGVLLALAFPRFSLSMVSLIALVPLLIALKPPHGPVGETVSPRRAFGLGYITGAVFFLVLLYWIPLLPPENVTIPFLMYPALALMVAYLALYPALCAALAAWLQRRGVPLGLSFPLTWTLTEALRGTGTFGFPWGSLGYALAPLPHLIQFASLTGVWGVTLWIVLVNGLVHSYLATRWVLPKVTVLLVLIVVTVAPYQHGRWVLRGSEPSPTVDVGIVQPNVGNEKWQLGVRDSVVMALVERTEELMTANRGAPLALVVWPETAIPVRLPREPRYRIMVESLVDSAGVPLLAGFPDGERLPDGDLRWTNSAALVLPGRGIVAQYDKRHLVPFSEYFPLPILNRYDFGQSNFSAGTRPGVFDQAGVPFGVLICFESIFPGPARDLSRNGARYLVNITNDQWFGDSAAPIQHFEMNILRAIENRMGMARAANTGISAVITPYGAVELSTRTFEQTNVVAPVELGRELTFYARHGDWILAVAAALLAALIAAALLRRRAR